MLPFDVGKYMIGGFMLLIGLVLVITAFVSPSIRKLVAEAAIANG